MDVPSTIEVERRERLVITWEDGGRSVIPAADLRRACPCATCRDRAEAVGAAELPTGGAPVTIEGADLVGAYALHVLFGPDGHRTGIYPFSLLRTIGAPSAGAG